MHALVNNLLNNQRELLQSLWDSLSVKRSPLMYSVMWTSATFAGLSNITATQGVYAVSAWIPFPCQETLSGHQAVVIAGLSWLFLSFRDHFPYCLRSSILKRIFLIYFVLQFFQMGGWILPLLFYPDRSIYPHIFTVLIFYRWLIVLPWLRAAVLDIHYWICLRVEESIY